MQKSASVGIDGPTGQETNKTETVKIRNFLYNKNILKTYNPHTYTVSVGNLTTGGTGKTPITSEIANYFAKKGDYPAILSRGYGGKIPNIEVNVVSDGTSINYTAQEAGDEPVWLAKHCPACAVLTCASRVKAAKFAKNKLHCTKLILDDGYQHRKIGRDLNILVVDSEKQFSNGLVLPLGALREPVSEIKRADKVIIVNEVRFRESICRPCNELASAGYIDVKTPTLFGNLVGQLRFSNYLPEEEVGKHIMRLRQYYDVGFEEAIYYVEDRVFYFNFLQDNRAIVRIFPMEDYCKIDPDIKMKEYRYGIIYIRETDEFQMQDIDSAFDYIPDETSDSVIYMREPIPIEIGVKPVKKELLSIEE